MSGFPSRPATSDSLIFNPSFYSSTSISSSYLKLSGGALTGDLGIDGSLSANNIDCATGIRGKGLLSCSNTSISPPSAGQIMSYHPTMATSTSTLHIAYGRSTVDSDRSHYGFRSVYFAQGSNSNHTIWGQIGSSSGVSLSKEGLMRISGPGYNAQEATGAVLEVYGGYSSSIAGGQVMTNTNQYFYGSSAATLGLRTTHSILCEAAIFVTSDERLKKGIERLSDDDCLKCLDLNAISFHWNDQSKPGKQIGFSAQEVRSIIPEVVSIVPNPTLEEVRDEAGNVLIPDKHQLVLRQNDLLPYVLGTVKIQQKRIEQLEALVERLASRPVVQRWIKRA